MRYVFTVDAAIDSWDEYDFGDLDHPEDLIEQVEMRVELANPPFDLLSNGTYAN